MKKSKVSPVKMAQEELPDEEAEEGELGIPAFIRKKMKQDFDPDPFELKDFLNKEDALK